MEYMECGCRWNVRIRKWSTASNCIQLCFVSCSEWQKRKALFHTPTADVKERPKVGRTGQKFVLHLLGPERFASKLRFDFGHFRRKALLVPEILIACPIPALCDGLYMIVQHMHFLPLRGFCGRMLALSGSTRPANRPGEFVKSKVPVFFFFGGGQGGQTNAPLETTKKNWTKQLDLFDDTPPTSPNNF